MASTEHRLSLSQRDKAPDKIEKRMLIGRKVPIKPRNRRILAIRVVGPMLALTEFISGQKHRNSLRQGQCRQKISLLLRADPVGDWIVGRTFDAAVPTFI